MAEETAHGAYVFTVRLAYPNRVGMLAQVTSAIGSAGGDIGAIDIIDSSKGRMVRDITVTARDPEHSQDIVARLSSLDGVSIIQVADPTFQLHLGGKIEVANRVAVKNRTVLSMVYTPGVGRVSEAIARIPASVWTLTSKRNTVAVVSDGTAVLGLGNVGPLAALPVMEGKAMLFKELAGVDAWPLCLNTSHPDEIVRVVTAVAPGFGGINLEDIAAPRCFDIEARLQAALDIPVFHDDQHGTAIVVLAGLINAAKVVGKPLEALRAVIVGLGAAGIGTARLLLTAGVKDIVGCDTAGVLYAGRQHNMNPAKEWLARHTNPRGVRGTVRDALVGADFLLTVSRPGAVSAADLEVMNRDPIVFSLANPIPEIRPEEVAGRVRVMATGRSDYANQVNNVLCFPGLFRGVLDVRAREINDAMKLAAAQAIAAAVPESHLHEDYIVPSVFNRAVVRLVARAVAKAAYRTGVARKRRPSYSLSHLYWQLGRR